MRKSFFVLAVFLLTSGFLKGDTSTFSDTYYLSQVQFFNPCNGETVWMDGWERAFMRFHFAKDRIRSKLSWKNHFEGIGETTGAEYIANGGFTVMWNESMDGPQVGTSVNVKTTLVSKGGEPNFTVHGNWHIQVNANGDVAVERPEYYREECRG